MLLLLVRGYYLNPPLTSIQGYPLGRASTELARGSSRRVRANRLGLGYSRAEECLLWSGDHEAEFSHGSDLGRHGARAFVVEKNR
jgi:hypothetical protein